MVKYYGKNETLQNMLIRDTTITSTVVFSMRYQLMGSCPCLPFLIPQCIQCSSRALSRSSKVSFPAVHSTCVSDFYNHMNTREGLRHLASLKFDTRANIAIVSICSLLLWKVTSKWVLIYGRGLEFIVLLHCLLPSYWDCGHLSGHLYWVLLVFWWGYDQDVANWWKGTVDEFKLLLCTFLDAKLQIYWKICLFWKIIKV